MAQLVLAILAALALAGVAIIGATVAVSHVLRLHMAQISLFLGPTILKRNWRHTEIVIRLIPLTGYVQLPGMNPYEEELAEGVPAPGYRLITDLPTTQQALVPLSQLVGLALLAAGLLGPADAWHHAVSGLWQIPLGAISPLATGRELVTDWSEVLSSRGVLSAVGILIAKALSFELLPIGSASLLRALGWLFGLVRSRRLDQVLVGCQLLSLLVVVSWLVAMATSLYTAHLG